MPKQRKSSKQTIFIRWLLSVLLAGAAAVILTKNWDIVEHSVRVARTANGLWLLAALCLTALTFCVAALVYVTLALKPLRYRQAVLVEASTAFVNRLLPSGIGGLGVHGLYLYRQKHTPAEATAVMSVNNLLGMGGHLSLLLFVLLFSPNSFQTLQEHYHANLNGKVIALCVIVIVALLMIKPLRVRLAHFVANIAKGIRKIGLAHTLRALAFAICLTATYTATLFASTRAVHIHLGIVQVFIVFSIGMLAGTAAPTPGGLVGMEAGLFAGFIGYGVSDSLAGAIVLIYRLATYWLPLLPGLVALGAARRQKLL